MASRFAVLAVALLRFPMTASGLSSVGETFGPQLQVMASAREAATGGIAMEDRWRNGGIVEATTIVLTPGLRWYGVGAQGGTEAGMRITADWFRFGALDIPGTDENADGSFAGTTGTFGVSEWGARLAARRRFGTLARWGFTGIGRATGLVQQLPGGTSAGIAIEAGGEFDRSLDSGAGLFGWVLVGPLGRGADRWFAGRVLMGGGIRKRVNGFLTESGGFAVGAEGELRGEGPLGGGVGGVYWFGQPARPGVSLFVRGGIRGRVRSAQTLQPRAGLGFTWHAASGVGFQFDYAYAPIGELGTYHYGTISVRFPGRSEELLPGPFE